ncbi:AMP-binding protein [Streptomyces sp. SID5785]|uniref:fatty acyl-AMP ligase n=1 Tax=Streptomyces sp. SID5785 TaxID=2690309 RepID=UPI00136165F9|nr:fatty acyl-AMP ligase [Streptomyces sp. SID5785]MZD07806.1 AMP-binding protein [Streptomyces sp. SID5785]
MSEHRTFVELISDHIRRSPDRQALHLLPESDEAGRARQVSYRALDTAARELAGWLQARGATGERVLLMHASRHQFAVSLLACLYAGAIAVPVPATGRGRHHLLRVAGLVKDAAPCATFTDAALAPDVSRLLASCGYGSVPCLAADAVPVRSPWEMPELTPDTVAYLQYTSGSTGAPRGVVVTHGNLLANLEAIAALTGAAPGERVGGWLPLHHDMGLVGQLLLPLYLGGTSVLLSPGAFLKRPARWLEAIGRYDITVSGAPDFAYDLCLRRVTDEQAAQLDLSRWRTAVSGGEPVSAATSRAFAERFAAAGLRPGALMPCYGLAEATLLVSGERREAGPVARAVDGAALERHVLRDTAPGRPERELVACGRPAGAEVAIVDPQSLRVLPDGHVGEIWVRGPGVARGYWRDAPAAGEVFGASTAEGEGGYLRTGDLGTLLDGRLMVTGRHKDMIVVAGRNLYPNDLEHAVQRINSLFGTGTAFSVPGERERVVLVQELRTHKPYGLDLTGLTADVERCLAEEFEVAVDGVLLVRPGTIRRTTSGKVERAATRRLFLNGEIKPLHQRIDEELLPAAARPSGVAHSR